MNHKIRQKISRSFLFSCLILFLSFLHSQAVFGAPFTPDSIDKLFSEALGKDFRWIVERIDAIKKSGTPVSEHPYHRSKNIQDGFTYTWKGKDGLTRELTWHTRDASPHLPPTSNSAQGSVIKYTIGSQNGDKFIPHWRMVPTQKGGVFLDSKAMLGSKDLLDDRHIPASGNRNVKLYESGKNAPLSRFSGKFVPVFGIVIGAVIGVLSGQSPLEAASESTLSWAATTFPPVGLALASTGVASVALVGVRNANQWVQDEHQRMYRETICLPLWESTYKFQFCLSEIQKEDFLKECTEHHLKTSKRKKPLRPSPIAPRILKDIESKLIVFVQNYSKQSDIDQDEVLGSYLNKLIGEKSERDQFFTDFLGVGNSNMSSLSRELTCVCQLGLDRAFCNAGVFNVEIWFIGVVKKLLKQLKEPHAKRSPPKVQATPGGSLPTIEAPQTPSESPEADSAK